MLKNIKPKIIAISAIALIIAGAVNYVYYLIRPLSIIKNPNIPNEFTYNSEKIALAWTDDNEGETLIIKSDKKEYSGFNQADVYFSITNISNKDQDADILLWLESEKESVEKIERINNGDGSISNFQFPISKQIPNSNSQTADSKDKSAQPKSGFAPAGKIGYAFNDRLNSGKTSYYKATLKFPPLSKGEFLIEAIGSPTNKLAGILLNKLLSKDASRSDLGYPRSDLKGSQAYGLLDPWYSSSWTYKRAITLQGSKIATTTANFPILATTTLADLKTTTNGGKVGNANGYDIIFVDSDGSTLLNYEREKYASTTGEIAYWIKTDIASSTDKTIYMYYGNSGASDTATTTGVWDSNFKMVQHLKETDIDGGAGDIKDSTVNANNGTTSGMNTADQVTGQIDGSFDFDGADFVDVNNSSSLQISGDKIVLSAWYYHVHNQTGGHLVGKTTTDWVYILSAFPGVDGFSWPDWKFLLKSGGVTTTLHYTASTQDLDIPYRNTWVHLVGVYNGSTMKLYLNGIERASVSASGNINTTNDALCIGSRGNDHNYPFTGKIDEVRVSNTARTAGWITTEYNNQSSVGNFMTFGAEEANVPPTITLAADSPDPVSLNSTITFSVNWNDITAGENVKVKICKTNSLTNQNCDGGSYASSSAFTTNNPATVTYAVQAGDFGLKDYYVFVCDDDGNCSSSTYGTFAIKVSQINSPQTNLLTSGLVGYWSFNGQDMDWASSTAEALDRSGNSNNGNVMNFGKEAVTPGVSGQALSFDGVNDYVISSAGTNFNSTSIATIAGWVKVAAVNNDFPQIIKQTSNTVNEFEIALGIDKASNKFQFQTCKSNVGCDTVFSLNQLNLNTWAYLVGIFNGSNLKFYVDNIYQGTTNYTQGSVIAGNNFLFIGSDNTGGTTNRFFNGLIDEARVYNRALSAAEISELYRAGASKKMQVNSPVTNTLTSGLVGSWTFNGQNMDWSQSSAEARDTSGRGNHGNVMNFGKEAVTPGIVGQGLRFDGVDDYVNAGNLSSLKGSTVLTVCSWVKTISNVSSGITRQISSDANEIYWLLNKNANGTISFWVTARYMYWDAHITGTTAVNNGAWQHVCAVYNGTNDLKLYVNGVSEGSITGTEPVNLYYGGLATSVPIGSDGIGGFFDGSIDETRIYNRALSADEIGQLYRAGARRVKY